MTGDGYRRLIYIGILIGLLVATRYFQGIRRPAHDLVKDRQSIHVVIEELRKKKIVYTDHADCRMACRHISVSEVESTLANGKLNLKKSDPGDQPCPTYALEDRTADGQMVRIIIADCGQTARIVTAIDLKNEYRCQCD